MNCENCKNKHATVFYADEGGGRHALCQGCAQTLGKISAYSPSADSAPQAAFIPRPTLTTLEEKRHGQIYSPDVADAQKRVCPFCATSLDSVRDGGRVGCPECYTVFGDVLFPSSLSPDRAPGARMPASYRASIDRTRSISELKSKIKIAIEAENYELAATLRDKIRTLEGNRA